MLAHSRSGKDSVLKSLFMAVLVVALGFQSFPLLAKDPVRPVPLVEDGHSVDWWFVFKFNSKVFPGCGGHQDAPKSCPFGGEPQDYTQSEQFVFASSEDPKLKKGRDCLGSTTADPVGSTYSEIYNGSYYYVVWNDQFYGDPAIEGCGDSCSAPWGHSKGMLAWDDSGEGLLMQVSTPSWPAAGSARHPREGDGNTLGCVNDDDVKVSQHFFALKLSKSDVVNVIKGLKNASVVTDPQNLQVVKNGGPSDIERLVQTLGKKSKSRSVLDVKLSTGVELISKPSAMHVPPWQLVSSELDGVALRTATWWTKPAIDTTKADTEIDCWDDSLEKPGPVEIATSGGWDGKKFSLKGGPSPDGNHAKIGVSTSGEQYYSIFGDMNQQGTLSGDKCNSSQNGRGGLFFVVESKPLNESIKDLISGDTAPAE